MYVGVKLFGNKRLLDIVVGSGGITCLQILGCGEAGGKKDDGISIHLSDVLHHFDTVHDRHVDIRYDDIGLKVSPRLQSFLAVNGGFHFISSDDILEAAFLHIGEVFIILNQEQLSISHNRISFSMFRLQRYIFYLKRQCKEGMINLKIT